MASLDEALERALNALGGIASCGTHCPGCEMLSRIARGAIAEIEQKLKDNTSDGTLDQTR